jgi:predicted DNA-binding protein YlxM (UPF0122 family)
MRAYDQQSWVGIAGALAAWSLGLLAATGLVLYGIPWAGDEADLAAWRVLGLDAQQWADLHRVAGIALLVAGAVALALGRLEVTRRRAAHALAASLILLLAAATLWRWPPVSWLLEDEAELAAPGIVEPMEEEGLPYPEAGDEPLAEVARNLGMDATRVRIALQGAGLRFQDLDESLAEIAENNGTTPRTVYEAIRHLEAPALAPHEEGTLDLIEARFAGRDIRTRSVAQLADENSVPLDTALQRLRALGIEADASTTAGTLAAKHGLDPIDVVVVIALESPLRSHPAH